MTTQLVAMLGGVVLAGLVMIVGGVRLGRSSRGALPDEQPLVSRWDEHDVVPLPDGSPALRRAAWRLRPVGTEGGEDLLGLPAASGVRLPGRVHLDGQAVDVGDVWDVTAVLRTRDRVTGATVRVRAVAAVPLPVAGPPVVVAAEGHLSQLRDAAGLRDVQVESEVFNREWRVRSSDHDGAPLVLTPQVQLALHGHAQRFALELRDGLLTVHQVGRRADGPGLAGCLDQLLDLTRAVLAGTDPHTWPSPRPPDWTDAPVVVDPRPPGTAHPAGSGAPARFLLVLGACTTAGAALILLLASAGVV